MNDYNGAFNLNMYDPGDEEQETVSLIASGYDWECPSCKHMNNEPEVYNQVTCASCEKVFEVNQEDIRHAFC